MNAEDEILRNQSKAELPRARARYIAQSIQLEESDAPGVVSLGIAATVILVIAFIVWTYITPVNEVAISEGKVVPHGNNHIVQHFEGGIVEDILVHDGELVSAGDVLLEVSPIAIESEYDQLRTRSSSLLLKQVRLQALLLDETPDFGQYADLYPELTASEYEAYLAQSKSYQAQVRTAQTKVKQRQKELKRELAKSAALKEELEVVQQQVKIRAGLAKKGVVPKTELLDRQAELADVRTEFIQSSNSVGVVRESIQETGQASCQIQRIVADLILL